MRFGFFLWATMLVVFLIPIASAVQEADDVCQTNTECVRGDWIYNDSYDPYTDFGCTINITYPNGTQAVTDGQMTNHSNAWHNYTFIPPVDGYYICEMFCNMSGDVGRKNCNFVVLDITIYNINETISEINQTTYDILTNQTTLYNLIDSLANITESDVWTYATRILSDYSGVWTVAARTLTDYNQTEMWAYLTDINQSTEIDILDLINSLNNLSASDVWTYTTRSLTDYNQTDMWLYLDNINTTVSALPSEGDIWTYADRNLTYTDWGTGTLYVWNSTSRNLTWYNGTAEDVWTYGTREITGGNLTTMDWTKVSDLSDLATQTNTTEIRDLINGLANITAADVWVYTTRNLTDYNQSDVWIYFEDINIT